MKKKKRLICTLLVLVTVLSSSVLINAASWKVVKKGDRGTDVKTIQYLLKSKGYRITVDGDYGKRTEGNIKGFQTARGLKRDGIVGEKTWLKLIVTLQRGEESNAVRALQCQLGIKEDGDFDEITEDAVIRFQKRYPKLKNDGIVGPETWRYLINN
ncbi:peptidoglycan-binding domain-containing protein [Vallitalea sp.]|jgi:peptidoglycan hydrolase-like protein with peptidoglycan-binding domain|uniref:peptidoglycan-binding domain-containing protein n=1 Tax=Vallitalea sp. TaxID=1882829 RepID=UPI0025EFCB37|nr:peptidoglycan-binding protein [Vallitalea sp.]MCT4687104.1 peptidoglycan-binding protein [Vallitalea sp.]